MLKKRQKKKNKLKTYFLITMFLTGATFLFTVDFGVIKLINLRQERSSLQFEIEQLLTQQITIREEIKKLKYDTSYVEKIARERFLMVKPGEKVFKVIESKQIQ
tara:strand:+ start:1335 stop:1646 length:312 start_codon:yes stop_codon:yes gene_type:complete